jgi:hypothetical protein
MKTLISILLLSNMANANNNSSLLSFNSELKNQSVSDAYISTSNESNLYKEFANSNLEDMNIFIQASEVENPNHKTSSKCNHQNDSNKNEEGHAQQCIENKNEDQASSKSDFFDKIPTEGFGLIFKVIEINVSLKGNGFHSINEAVSSIPDGVSNFKYKILVDTGIYETETIDLTNKPFVSIIGSGSRQTIIKPSKESQNLIVLGAYNEVSNLRLTKTDFNFAAIVCNNSGNFSIGRDLVIDRCGYGIVMTSNSHTTPCAFYGERIEILNAKNNPVFVKSDFSGKAYVQFQNLIVLTTEGFSKGICVSGKHSIADIENSCFHKSPKVLGSPLTSLAGGVIQTAIIHTAGWEDSESNNFEFVCN